MLVLSCGLGSLGQYCVVNLKNFGIRVTGIDLNRPKHWEVGQLDALLDELIEDDARKNGGFGTGRGDARSGGVGGDGK
jgi:hypothetical protein